MDRFTKRDLDLASARLSMLKYLPTGEGAQAAIQALLAEMCPHKQALTWLVDTLVNRIGEWPGPAELRGLLCWKFQPADGIEATCNLQGFRPVDAEAMQIEKHEAIKGGGFELPDDQHALISNLVDRKKWLQ